jgi:hypothetical protein
MVTSIFSVKPLLAARRLRVDLVSAGVGVLEGRYNSFLSRYCLSRVAALASRAEA